MKKQAILLIVTASLASTAAARFPEFGFCPLGGPPGWFNRLTNQHRRYYYPPPPPPRYAYPVYPQSAVALPPQRLPLYPAYPQSAF